MRLNVVGSFSRWPYKGRVNVAISFSKGPIIIAAFILKMALKRGAKSKCQVISFSRWPIKMGLNVVISFSKWP